jgi:hypothetical protein
MPDSLDDIQAGVEEELRPAGITTAATPPIPKSAAVDSKSIKTTAP